MLSEVIKPQLDQTVKVSVTEFFRSKEEKMLNHSDQAFWQISSFLPPRIRTAMEQLPKENLQELEEIRLRPSLPVLCRFRESEALLCRDGKLMLDVRERDPILVEPQEMRRLLVTLGGSSLYALEEELRRGFITLPGGHRAGFSGQAVLEHGNIKTIRELSSVNLRLARPVMGAAAALLPKLLDAEGRFLSTLLISPPRAGKTTLLRDLARMLSDGEQVKPCRVGIADERSEIAALRQGVPQLPVGLRTDVMDGCPKAEAMLLLLRSMSPDVLVTDELGRSEDALAVLEAGNAGAAVLASAHGFGVEDVALRPGLRILLEQKAFRRLAVLSRRRGPGTVEKVVEI